MDARFGQVELDGWMNRCVIDRYIITNVQIDE